MSIGSACDGQVTVLLGADALDPGAPIFKITRVHKTHGSVLNAFGPPPSRLMRPTERRFSSHMQLDAEGNPIPPSSSHSRTSDNQVGGYTTHTRMYRIDTGCWDQTLLKSRFSHSIVCIHTYILHQCVAFSILSRE